MDTVVEYKYFCVFDEIFFYVPLLIDSKFRPNPELPWFSCNLHYINDAAVTDWRAESNYRTL